MRSLWPSKKWLSPWLCPILQRSAEECVLCKKQSVSLACLLFLSVAPTDCSTQVPGCRGVECYMHCLQPCVACAAMFVTSQLNACIKSCCVVRRLACVAFVLMARACQLCLSPQLRARLQSARKLLSLPLVGSHTLPSSIAPDPCIWVPGLSVTSKCVVRRNWVRTAATERPEPVPQATPASSQASPSQQPPVAGEGAQQQNTTPEYDLSIWHYKVGRV